MTDYTPEQLNVVMVTREKGVADLPLKVRLHFGKAIVAEREGRDIDAANALDAAIKAGKD
jgi:hypothetical protein